LVGEPPSCGGEPDMETGMLASSVLPCSLSHALAVEKNSCLPIICSKKLAKKKKRENYAC
jgi:hypothetical protein